MVTTRDLKCMDLPACRSHAAHNRARRRCSLRPGILADARGPVGSRWVIIPAMDEWIRQPAFRQWIEDSLARRENILAVSNQGTLLRCRREGLDLVVKAAMGRGPARALR